MFGLVACVFARLSITHNVRFVACRWGWEFSNIQAGLLTLLNQRAAEKGVSSYEHTPSLGDLCAACLVPETANFANLHIPGQGHHRQSGLSDARQNKKYISITRPFIDHRAI